MTLFMPLAIFYPLSCQSFDIFSHLNKCPLVEQVVQFLVSCLSRNHTADCRTEAPVFPRTRAGSMQGFLDIKTLMDRFQSVFIQLVFDDLEVGEFFSGNGNHLLDALYLAQLAR